MDSNRVKGTVDELVGAAKKNAGKLTGNTRLQIEGAAQQVKGKLKDTVRAAKGKASMAGKRVV